MFQGFLQTSRHVILVEGIIYLLCCSDFYDILVQIPLHIIRPFKNFSYYQGHDLGVLSVGLKQDCLLEL